MSLISPPLAHAGVPRRNPQDRRAGESAGLEGEGPPTPATGGGGGGRPPSGEMASDLRVLEEPQCFPGAHTPAPGVTTPWASAALPASPPSLQPRLSVLTPTFISSVTDLPSLVLVPPTHFQGLPGDSPQGQGTPRDSGLSQEPQGWPLELEPRGYNHSGGLGRKSSVPKPLTPGRSRRSWEPARHWFADRAPTPF